VIYISDIFIDVLM